MTSLLIFGWPSCPYCIRAKKLADDHDIPYQFIDIQRGSWYFPHSGKRMTSVPQIYIMEGNKMTYLRGGYTGLMNQLNGSNIDLTFVSN